MISSWCFLFCWLFKVGSEQELNVFFSTFIFSFLLRMLILYNWIFLDICRGGILLPICCDLDSLIYKYWPGLNSTLNILEAREEILPEAESNTNVSRRLIFSLENLLISFAIMQYMYSARDETFRLEYMCNQGE